MVGLIRVGKKVEGKVRIGKEKVGKKFDLIKFLRNNFPFFRIVGVSTSQHRCLIK